MSHDLKEENDVIMANNTTIKTETLEYYPETSISQFGNLISPEFSKYQELAARIIGAPDLKDAPVTGFTASITLTKPIAPPGGSGESVIMIKSVILASSPEVGSNLSAPLSATLVGFSPGQDPNKEEPKYKIANVITLEPIDSTGQMKEFDDKGKPVVYENSWWGRILTCFNGGCCRPGCFSAAMGCSKINWTAFFACLTEQCGSCVAKCAAYATCNCTWWCEWGVGCCQ
jgi:hypothetical protein